MSGLAASPRSLAAREAVEAPKGMMRYIDWIWHVRGTVPLPAGQLPSEAFDRLTPLFEQTGTSHEIRQETLTFTKKDAAAQDKMSVFDSGTLRIVQNENGQVLRYALISKALLYCFLAPLLFLAFAQATIAINAWQSPAKEAAAKAKTAVKKPVAKEAPLPMNPIDKMLGAPAPDKPEGGDADEDGPKSKKPSPTPSYVFAGIFVALYLLGRILEDRLIRSLFRKKLQGV